MAAALLCGALLFGFIIVTRFLYKAFLMDKIHTEASQSKKEDQSATTSSTMMNLKEVGREFKRSVMDEGQEILKRLDDLLGRTTLLGLKGGGPTRSLQTFDAPCVEESEVVGRDGDKEKIIELLLSDDTRGKNLSVIPIVGMGGLGKTTLALLVYEDSRVQQHFDFKVWVTVSEEFDVFRITKAIYEAVTSEEWKTKELIVLQHKLKKALVGKIFLFVLDDIWNENYRQWDSLKSGFQSGAHGSKIIVTTRSKVVALIMNKRVMHELELVSDEDCWRIFEKHAFDDSEEVTAQLKEIGRKIVDRCKGLPLAVKSVAGLLRTASNAKEWEMILQSDVWLKDDIVPALWLSYHFLPPALKRCFAFCSIFPKDYEFCHEDMEKLVLLWMAEGLLTPEKGKRMEDVGKAYLKALISRSFFQPLGRIRRGKPTMVMHDLVHDLAMFISDEFCFSCGDSNDLSNLRTKSCHLSYTSTVDLMKLGAVYQSKEKKLMSLRTLLGLPLIYGHGNRVLDLHELFLKVGGCLRVLSLFENSITELPDSIGNMKYLRYLDLSLTKIKELPDSICTFYNLQTLLLSNCLKLAQLPTRLAALVNLRHLDISYCPCLKEMPPQMCKMKSLQTLSDFVLGENDSGRIKELGEFPLLEGRLCISGLQYIVDVKDVLEANLKDKKFLSQLILKWGGDSNITSSQQEREVLEALQPHTNLKELTIMGYRGTIFLDWVGHKSFSSLKIEHCDEIVDLYVCQSRQEMGTNAFSSLESIEIIYCKKLIVGLPDCHLPSLRELSIINCSKMEGVFVCQSRQEMDTNAFPSLQSISITGCKKLWENRMKWGLERLPSLMTLSLCCMGIKEELDSFPEEGLLPTTLTHLSISYFTSLKGLNGRGFQHLTSLQNLDIIHSKGLECLPEEGLPLSLSSLTIIGCSEVLEQRCQIGTGEDWPKIQHIPKIHIN